MPSCVSQFTALCVGFLEEVIFRGLLLMSIARKNVKSAIIISSVTFGVGHIINLFNGSGMDLVTNLCQIVFAIAVGFLLVTIFYRGGSLCSPASLPMPPSTRWAPSRTIRGLRRKCALCMLLR